MINKINIDLQGYNFLSEHGFYMPVIIQMSSTLYEPPISKAAKTIIVMAHLDSGATTTSISEKLAKELDLNVLGYSKILTGAGEVTFPDFMVDISFPDNVLSSFVGLRVGSCILPYNPALPGEQILSPSNFGVLIGRDMMSRWNIVWNGPTSSVFISD